MKRRAASTAEQRQKILEEFRQSGLSVTEFARQKGLPRGLVSAWLMRAGRQLPVVADGGTAVCWQEATLHQLLGQSTWAAEVGLPGGVTVRLDAVGRAQLLGYLHRHLQRC